MVYCLALSPQLRRRWVLSVKPDKSFMDKPIKPDESIMDVSEHVSRLSGRIVTIDDRSARWEKKMTKLEKKMTKTRLRPFSNRGCMQLIPTQPSRIAIRIHCLKLRDSGRRSRCYTQGGAGEVAACGVKIRADSESQWILVTWKKNKSNKNDCQLRG
jgi:hypothetical protein